MIRKSSSSGGSPSAQNQHPERMSFDHPTSSDVAGPPMSSMSPTPSTNSNYERETKRVRTDQHSSAPDQSVLSAPSPPVVSAPAPPPSPPPPPETKSAPADARNVCKSVPAGKGSTSANTDHSLLNSFTIKQLETHLASLDKTTQLAPAQFKQKCLEVLKGLQTHQHGWVFNCPVDPIELGLTDYFVIIKKPMDLGSVQKKLDNGVYRSVNEFESDVKLTFENAMTYNEKGSVVYDMANELMTKFAADYKTFLAQLRSEDQLRRQNERACVLCGCEQLLFEPPVYFCNGMNCQSQRIRRNSHFYVGGSNQYFWCSACYNELDGNIPIELADMSIMKADLTKKKNDEVHEESWVECTSCERWVHQICGLFNTRQNKEKESEYCCPKCLLERRKTTEINPSSRPLCADDLPRTTLSEWLEKHVSKKVERQKQEIAEEKSRTEVSQRHTTFLSRCLHFFVNRT
jgi:E1A/CREB-binding protein